MFLSLNTENLTFYMNLVKYTNKQHFGNSIFEDLYSKITDSRTFPFVYRKIENNIVLQSLRFRFTTLVEELI